MREPHPLIGVRASSCAKGLRALRQTIEGIEWLGGERPALPDPHPRPCRDQGCSEVLPRVMAKFDRFAGNIISRRLSCTNRRELVELVVGRPSRKARFRNAGVSLPNPKSRTNRARATSGALKTGHGPGKNFFYKALDKPIRRTID
jgi:hypothetical protein